MVLLVETRGTRGTRGTIGPSLCSWCWQGFASKFYWEAMKFDWTAANTIISTHKHTDTCYIYYLLFIKDGVHFAYPKDQLQKNCHWLLNITKNHKSIFFFRWSLECQQKVYIVPNGSLWTTRLRSRMSHHHHQSPCQHRMSLPASPPLACKLRMPVTCKLKETHHNQELWINLPVSGSQTQSQLSNSNICLFIICPDPSCKSSYKLWSDRVGPTVAPHHSAA